MSGLGEKTENPDFEWEGKSNDPNDELFGDIVSYVSLDEDRRVEEHDVALLGEPFDGAVIGRKGAREGPEALRRELAGTKTHHIDAGPVSDVCDIGDIDIDNEGAVSEVQSLVSEVTERIHELDVFPVFLGGDNSLTYANASPLVSIESDTGAISFDAHFDCREVFDEPSSGTPYRQLHEDGLDSFAVVGARHFENSTTYAKYVDKQGGEIVTAEEVEEDAVKAVDLALDAMDADSIYVSVDLDVLDASEAPGVSAPTPGGITTRELFRMLRVVASDERVEGFEVVECAPRLDSDNRTSKAGARAVAHFLSCLRLRS